jgi:hypothetical protein
MYLKLIHYLLVLILFGCAKKTEVISSRWSDLFEQVSPIDDSIKVGDMVVHNAFKHQILAHSGQSFDSIRILNQVYLPNKHAFDNCLGQIFGEENGTKFIANGLYDWNKTLLQDHDSIIYERLSVIKKNNINELFETHLTAVQEITGQKGSGSWMLYFGPQNFQILGGCDQRSMILDMFSEEWNEDFIHIVFAHEIEHLIFEPILANDIHGNTGLGITLDEGLAVYFTSIYLNQDPEEALFQEKTGLLYEKESEIFKKLEPYLFKDYDEGCPIFKHCGRSDNCGYVYRVCHWDSRVAFVIF